MQNIQQLVAGEYHVAFSLSDTAADAVAGKGAFDRSRSTIQALARIYDNYTQVVVRTDSGITSVADMQGQADLHRLARSPAPRSSPTACCRPPGSTRTPTSRPSAWT